MRLTIAEDSSLLREGLVRLLEDEGHAIVAAVGDADQLLDSVAEDRPDVVIVDVRMPPTHSDEGLRAALLIRQRWPEIGILVLSQYVEPRHAGDLVEHGTERLGYLLKDRVAHLDDFLAALETVAGGGTALDPEVVRRLLSTSPRGPAIEGLTAREAEVLGLMAQGHTNTKIASTLHISESSVEKHVRAIFDTLGLDPGGNYNRRVLAILRYLEG